MSLSPIIGVVEQAVMAVETVGGVMSLSHIIGVVEHTAMAGGVISPIIGVVERPAMAGGVMSPSPIIGVEDQKTSIQMTSIQIQILSLSTVGGVMSQSPIIGVVEPQKYPKVKPSERTGEKGR